MSLNYTYAIKYSTTTILARAYKEYCESAAESYSTLMAMAQLALSGIDETNTPVQERVEYILSLPEFSEFSASSNVTLNNGVTSLENFLTAIITSGYSKFNEIDSTTPTGLESIVEITNLDGGKIQYDLNSLFAEMNATYHSIVVEAAAGLALMTDGGISEKINMARDYIQSYFASGFTDISNSLNNMIGKLREGIDAAGYIQSKLDSSGITQGAQENLTFSSSEDVSFTGASPASAYAWQSAQNQLINDTSKAVSAVCTTVSTILSGIVSIGSRIFSKIKTVVKETVIDPYDIKLVSENGNNTVNGFHYSDHVTIQRDSLFARKLALGPIHCDFIPCEVVVQKDEDYTEYTDATSIVEGVRRLAKVRKDSIDLSRGLIPAIQTITSKQYQTLKDAVVDYSMWSFQGTILDTINAALSSMETVNVCVLVKAKPINHLYLDRILSHYDDIATANDISLMDFVTQLNAMCEDPTSIYTSVDRSETDLYRDFATGLIFTKGLFNLLFWESRDSNHKPPLARYYVTFGINFNGFVDNTIQVTNYDFLLLLTKCQMKYKSGAYGWIDQDQFFKHDFSETLVEALTNVFDYREENPFSYPFWPYSHSSVTWFEPSMRLASDQEHQQAFSDAIVNLIEVTFITIITIGALVTLKKFANKASIQAMGSEWLATEAASKGELTDDIIHKYKWDKFKANALSSLSGNLVGVGSAVVSNSIAQLTEYDNSQVDLSPVIKLIKGTV